MPAYAYKIIGTVAHEQSAFFPQREEVMVEQLSEDDEFMLSTWAAAQYAGALITAVTAPLDELPRSNILKALSCARKIIGPLPAPVTSALCDLQVVAVLFTMQRATSEGGRDSEDLQRIGDKLIATLQQGTARIYGHDAAITIQSLSDRALDYIHQIILAKDNRALMDSGAVKQALTELHIAAVVFTTQLVTAESYDPTPLRRVEDKLVAKRRRRIEDTVAPSARNEDVR